MGALRRRQRGKSRYFVIYLFRRCGYGSSKPSVEVFSARSVEFAQQLSSLNQHFVIGELLAHFPQAVENLVVCNDPYCMPSSVIDDKGKSEYFLPLLSTP